MQMNLTAKFLVPVGAALALIMTILTGVVISTQANKAELAFQEHLTTLAVTSRFMIHSSAEEYCKSRSMAFHRALPGQVAGSGPAADFERTSLRAFENDPSLPFLATQYKDADGAPRMYVLAPAKLQDECGSCHAASGVDSFKGRKNGDLVGAFGVSISTAELQGNLVRTGFQSVLIGLAVLVVVGLMVAYFVRRNILRPLADLATYITHMAQGDLTVHAPVHSQDEIGQLAGTFNQMVGELNQALHKVEQASMRVASGSVQLAASAEENVAHRG
jgi:HAMP domain-containing protein